MPEKYEHNLFDYLNLNENETRTNIKEGSIVFMDKSFDELNIPDIFMPLGKSGRGSHKIKKFKDLMFYKFDEIIPQIKKNNQYIFTKYIDLICHGFEHYELNFLNAIKEINGFDILLKRANGEKLESIGQKASLTRERIRQIEKSSIEEVLVYAVTYFEVKNNNGYFKDMLFYNFKDMFRYTNDAEVVKVIEYALKSKNNYSFAIYSQDFDAFINPTKKSNINQIKKLINLNDHFNYFDCFAKINNTLIFNNNILDFTFDIYKNYLTNNNYSFKGNLAMKPGTCTTNSILSQAIREFYPKGIVLDEQGIKDLQKKLFNKYKYDFKILSAISKIDELNPELIVWGKQVRTHIDNVHIKEEKRQEIINEFEKIIENSSYILLDVIYNNDEIIKILNKTEINDKYKLYGYLKYYLKEKYYFKKMAVRKLDLKEYTLNELVYKYIDENDNTSIEEIVNKLDISLQSVQSIIRDDIRIIQTKKGYTLAHKIKISKADLKEIFVKTEEDLFDDSHKYGYTRSGYLHKDNLFNNHKEEWENMGINDSQMLYHIIRYYYSDKFHFYTPYIQSLEFDFAITFKKIISDYFSKNEGIIDIEKTQKDIGYISNTKDFSLIYSLKSFDIKYFRMGFDRMALLDNITFDDITKYMLNNRLTEFFDSHEYALEKDLEKLSRGLYYFVNDDKCYMNYYALCSYIENYSKEYFALCSLGINNYITSKYAVVCKSMKDINYLEFVYKVIRKTYTGPNANKLEVLKFIRDNKLLLNVPVGLFNEYLDVVDDTLIFKS